jgi:hypothetical protein
LFAGAGRSGHGRKLPHRTVQVTPDCDVDHIPSAPVSLAAAIG